MQWQEVCEHPSLRDLPFKIELNAQGQVLMSPVKVYHSAFQGRIARLLPENGVILAECAIHTPQGTKVADVAWASAERFAMIASEAECSIAPEICIEVVSSSNSQAELAEKRHLYLEAGAREYWICDEGGAMRFFDASGELPRSRLVADFPAHIEIQPLA
ncbi:MAG: Uma2 family endonuclease [Chromatiaceae bacterium]|nr:Uma2 family endonuclease [Chromatiaceae bacterium]